uniref:Uncharacterized protein n=1 Tax=uncultured marine virus TaxID=186617 RepID=A0A0F7L7L8_9VIRU|nr:hypothetical protein [uncultured marine virus]
MYTHSYKSDLRNHNNLQTGVCTQLHQPLTTNSNPHHNLTHLPYHQRLPTVHKKKNKP